LQGADVVALVGQGISASVPKHVRVRLEGSERTKAAMKRAPEPRGARTR
jgi:hypothetical protein